MWNKIIRLPQLMLYLEKNRKLKINSKEEQLIFKI